PVRHHHRSRRIGQHIREQIPRIRRVQRQHGRSAPQDRKQGDKLFVPPRQTKPHHSTKLHPSSPQFTRKPRRGGVQRTIRHCCRACVPTRHIEVPTHRLQMLPAL